MSIKEKLASQLGRRDEVPNQQLAAEIVRTANKPAIKELVSLLQDPKQNIRHNSIKTLYEIGYVDAKLIAPYMDEFLKLIHSKQNRMQWGAMTALSAIASVSPEKFYPHLSNILEAAEKGTVITRDHAMKILNSLSANLAYYPEVIYLLLEQLAAAPENQFPKYAEDIAADILPAELPELLKILTERVSVINTPTKAARVNKLIQKLQKRK